MIKDRLVSRYRAWAERIGYAAFGDDLENAHLLLSYDDKRTESTFSGVSVYAAAAHTDRVHVFLFTVRTTWRLDARGDTDETLKEDYKLLLSF